MTRPFAYLHNQHLHTKRTIVGAAATNTIAGCLIADEVPVTVVPLAGGAFDIYVPREHHRRLLGLMDIVYEAPEVKHRLIFVSRTLAAYNCANLDHVDDESTVATDWGFYDEETGEWLATSLEEAARQLGVSQWEISFESP